MSQAVNSQKVEKAFTKGEKMFKQLTKASTPIEALTSLVMTIIDATGVLKPLQAVLDVILSLFGIMGSEIVPIMMEALRPLMDMLMDLAPLFREIGRILGYFIGLLISSFMPIIEALFEAFKPFIPLLDELMPLFELLFLLMFPFLPFLELLIPLIELLVPVIWGIVYAVRAIKSAIAGANKSIDGLIGWINDLAKAADSIGGGGGSKKKRDKDWWDLDIGLQSGTHYVPRTGRYTLHAGEEVKPAAYSGVQEELLSELLEETKRKTELDYFQNAFNRRRR